MGKFNNTDGINFIRSISDVVKDYAKFLLDKEIIDNNDFQYYITDGKEELLDILFERIYEIEAYRKNISTRYGIIGDIEKRIVDFYKGEFREIN